MDEQPSVQPTTNPITKPGISEATLGIPPKPENKSKKWLVIVLILLFLSAIGVAGYFAYQNYQLNNNRIAVTPKPYPIETKPTAKPTEGPLNQLIKDVNLYHSVMWIGAHADDEMFVAGTLGYLCKDNNYQCTIVSFGASSKMREGNTASANFLNNASYIRIQERLNGKGKEMNCSDKSYDCFVNQWQENGSQDELAKIIRERNPEIIITFGSGQEYGAKDVHAASSCIAEQSMKSAGGNYQHYYVINTMHLLTRNAQPEIEKASDVINLDNKLWSYRMKIISIYAPFYSPNDLSNMVNDKEFQATLLHKELYKKVN